MTEKKLPDWYLRKLSKAGKIGGKRSLKTMTPAERTARAKKAAAASEGAEQEGEEHGKGHEMTEKDVITQPELALETVPDLPALAAAINVEHTAVGEALKAGLSHAIRAGELLIEAKALAGHGEWLPWLAANCATISERTAQAYMSGAVSPGPSAIGGNPQRALRI